VLDELDREWSAGDIALFATRMTVISTSHERAGQAVMESISRFITQKLKLKVNEAKSAVARPQERKVPRVQPYGGRTFKPRLRRNRWTGSSNESTGHHTKGQGVSIKATMEELARYMLGWRGLFRLLRNARGADCSHSLGPLATCGLPSGANGKTPRRRRAALIALGISGSCEHGR